MGLFRESRDRFKAKLAACLPGKQAARGLSLTENPVHPHGATSEQQVTADKIDVLAPQSAQSSILSKDNLPGEPHHSEKYIAKNSNTENIVEHLRAAIGRDDVTQSEDGSWYVCGVGKFTNMSTYNFADGTLPTGLQINTQKIGAPSRHSKTFYTQYQTANVDMVGGILNLRIPGGQDPSQLGNTCTCAAVETSENQIQYASVRTQAIFSTVPGSCHGMFFYSDDNDEVDIEYLTDPNSAANPGNGAAPNVICTNQPLTPGQNATQAFVPAPADVTQFHEYRTDWVQGQTTFYIDGELVATLTDNVTDKPGKWMWNNWCNGNQAWSCGPPAQDNILQIQSIKMYYNVAPAEPAQ